MSPLARARRSVLACLVLGVSFPGIVHAFGPTRGLFGRDTSGGVAQLAGTPHTLITENAVKEVIAKTLAITRPSETNLRAISEICLSNAQVDVNQIQGQLHVDGETFDLAQQRLNKLRQDTIELMVLGDYNDARQKVGEALHTIQDFYSHTNWAELGHSEAHPRFGANNAGLDVSEWARRDEATCVVCKDHVSSRGCDRNLVTKKLTSGYYEGSKGFELDAPQPKKTPKCTHGGLTDVGALPTEGPANKDGINKDTKYRVLSPHHWLHEQAVSGATEATRNYLMTIHDSVQIWQFRDLFDVSGSFAAALDVSNSMENILNDVQDGVEAGVKTLRKGIGNPDRLVLAGFADDVTPRLRTTDLDKYLAAVGGLESRQSGDCAEASFEATLEALRMSEPGGAVFIITDGAVNDPQRAELIVATALEMNIRIIALLIQPEGVCETLDQATYQEIAERSGGLVVRMTRDDVEDQLASLLPLFGAPGGLNSLTVIDGPALKGFGPPPTVQVDSTMTQMSVVVSTKSPVLLRRPNGSPVADDDPGVIRKVRSEYVTFELTSPETGTWTIDSAEQASVYATSNSSLAFSGLDFVELKGRSGHQGYFAIDGLPVAGRPSIVTVDLTTPVAAAVLELRTPAGDVLVSGPLMPQLDPDGNPLNDGHYSAEIAAPTQPFVAFVTGTTQSNEPFVRSALRQVQPQYLALTTPPHQFSQPGMSADFVFTVQNTGVADQFVVHVEDTEGMLSTPAQQTLTLAQGESTSLTVSLRVPPAAKLGTESRVRVLLSSVSQPQLRTFAASELEVTPNLDVDGDGILDARDNCKSLSNPGQLDYDADGVGNECDTTPGEPPPETGCDAAESSAPLSLWWLVACAIATVVWLRKRRRAA